MRIEKDVESKIIQIQGTNVIIDSDVTKLYGVETRDINKAVKNNPNKFLRDYIIFLDKTQKSELVENFHRFGPLKHSTALPKAFTEKGLYMLATILKSPLATQTTISIIETFSRVKEFTQTIQKIPAVKENTTQYKSLVEKAGSIISDLVVSNELNKSESEASMEVNLAVVKFKYSVKKKPKAEMDNKDSSHETKEYLS